MIYTPGSNHTPLVVGDADGLIALLSEKDFHHQKALAIVTFLAQQETSIVFPITAIAEAVTTIQRKLKDAVLLTETVRRVRSGELYIEAVDSELMTQALGLFNPEKSKKHTLFDCLVAVFAKRMNADAIFSFDTFYEKIGMNLARGEI